MSDPLPSLPDNPFQQGAESLGAAASGEGSGYGGEVPAQESDNKEQQYQNPSSEEPFLHSVKNVKVFGDSSNPVEFSQGGSSVLPDGTSQNPEDYAAFPESVYKSGVVKPGQGVWVLNPATKRKMVVIARHVIPDGGSAMELAPHAYLELGGVPEKGLIVDFRAPKNYPIAQYSSPYQAATDAAAPEAPTAEPASLSSVSMSGGMTDKPGMLRNASAIDSPESPGPAASTEPKTNPDGSITYPSGKTYYKDGTYDLVHKDQRFVYSMKDGKLIDKQKIDAPKPLHDSIMKMFADRQIPPVDDNGKTITDPAEAIKKIAEFDKSEGRLDAHQQREVEKTLPLATSSRNAYAKQWLAMYPNYKSVIDNATNPGPRNGVSDAYLISAAAGLENPGRTTTAGDFSLLMKSQGIAGKAEVLWDRVHGLMSGDGKFDEGTRILSDAQVQQILQNSERAAKPRYDEYVAGQKPHINRLEKAGVDAKEYLPNLDFPSVTGTKMATPLPKFETGKSYRDKMGRTKTYKGGDPNSATSWE